MSRVGRYDGINIVSLPAAAHRLPDNPLITREPPSVAASGSQATDSQRILDFRKGLLRKDMLSVITGSPATDLQACHILNAVRLGSKNAPQRASKEEQRQQVVDLCQYLRFNGKDSTVDFDLDNIMNGILLESSLHMNWDLYATFAIVIPLQDLEDMIDQLERDNAVWDDNTEMDEHAVRILGAAEPQCHNYKVEKLTIVALSPAFLPRGGPLPVIPINDRSLHHARVTEWKQLRLDATADFYHDFHMPPSRRTCEEQISIFALVVNAFHKFQAWIKRQQDGDQMIRESSITSVTLERYERMLNKAVRLIFHTPYNAITPASESQWKLTLDSSVPQTQYTRS
ncbi:hypothetical protein FB107DRAFT_272386 [Schizophyllum commune]